MKIGSQRKRECVCVRLEEKEVERACSIRKRKRECVCLEVGNEGKRERETERETE